MTNLYQYEIMDRCHVFMESIDSSLLNHPGLDKEQKVIIERAMDALHECYQLAGNYSFYETRNIAQTDAPA